MKSAKEIAAQWLFSHNIDTSVNELMLLVAQVQLDTIEACAKVACTCAINSDFSEIPEGVVTYVVVETKDEIAEAIRKLAEEVK